MPKSQSPFSSVLFLQGIERIWIRGGAIVGERAGHLGLEGEQGHLLNVVGCSDVTISDMLHRGEIDGFIAPRPPSGAALANPDVGWLFDDPTAAAKDYYRRTGVFPIMHVVGIKQELAARHPWLPGAVLKAFTLAKSAALDKLADTSATKVTLPFVEEQLKSARETLGADYWAYGVQASRRTLEAFVRHHHAQGLSARLMSVDEIFHPATYESYSI